jgi:hypothetical protein
MTFSYQDFQQTARTCSSTNAQGRSHVQNIEFDTVTGVTTATEPEEFVNAQLGIRRSSGLSRLSFGQCTIAFVQQLCWLLYEFTKTCESIMYQDLFD